MSKSDGTKIVIQFDDSILSGIEGSESAFEVLVPEYDFVPGGPVTVNGKIVDNVKVSSISKTGITNSNGLVIFNIPNTSKYESLIQLTKKGYKSTSKTIDNRLFETIIIEELGDLPEVSGLELHLDAGQNVDLSNDTPYTIEGLELYLDATKEGGHE